MNHREIEACLPDFAIGALDDATRASIASHLVQCAACRSWMETYDALSTELSRRKVDEHPSSDLLARCAVRPDEADVFGGEGLLCHIDSCDDCRNHLERVRDAVRSARPSSPSSAPTGSYAAASLWWKVAAVVVAGVGIGSLLILGSLRSDDSQLQVFQTSSQIDDVMVDGTESLNEYLSGTELEGARLIEAKGSLTMTEVRIKDGANVTIRAGGAVVLGDGFQIEPGTRVSIGGGPGRTESSRQEQP